MNRLGRSALLPALAAAALLTAGCGAASDFQAGVSAGLSSSLARPSAAPAAAPFSPPPTVAAPPTAAAVAAPAASGSWVMPNLVGTNLQDAQDAIQALTADAIFVTTSHDATGAGRQQVLDRNWKVCSQNIRAGKAITPDSKIDFGAAKLTESC